MVVQSLQDVVTLLLECLLLCAFSSFIVFFGPACFEKSLDLIEVVVVDRPATRKVESLVDSLVDDLVDLSDNKVSLTLDRVGYIFIVDTLMNFTLHHS
jgi:hypothetical protein